MCICAVVIRNHLKSIRQPWFNGKSLNRRQIGVLFSAVVRGFVSRLLTQSEAMSGVLANERSIGFWSGGISSPLAWFSTANTVVESTMGEWAVLIAGKVHLFSIYHYFKLDFGIFQQFRWFRPFFFDFPAPKPAAQPTKLKCLVYFVFSSLRNIGMQRGTKNTDLFAYSHFLHCSWVFPSDTLICVALNCIERSTTVFVTKQFNLQQTFAAFVTRQFNRQ